MKVAIVHDWLTGLRGGELVLNSLLKVYPMADIFTLIYNKGSCNNLIENRRVVTAFTDKLPFKTTKYRWYLPLFPMAIESFDLRDYDLIISSSHCVAKGIIPSPNSIHISYIHTPMRYVWDLYYDYFPSNNSIKSLLYRMFSNYLRIWDVSSSNRVSHFISNSKFVSNRIWNYYKRESTVIFPPCIPDEFVFQKITNKDDFYLIVSAFAPYKKIDLAIEVFRKNKKKLIIIGGGQDKKKLSKNLPKNITILSGLSKNEVQEYYKKAKCFIFPGVEDFGIAPVEAQSFCTPIIAFGKGGALETIIHKKTGYFFYNQTVEDLSLAIDESERIHWNPDDFRKNILRFTEKKFITQFKKEVEKNSKGL